MKRIVFVVSVVLGLLVAAPAFACEGGPGGGQNGDGTDFNSLGGNDTNQVTPNQGTAQGNQGGGADQDGFDRK